MNRLIGYLDRACELAVEHLKKHGGHRAVLIQSFQSVPTVDVVEDHIEDAAFHEYLLQYRDSGYVLVATAEEDDQKYLVVEVWKNGKGVKREIPFQRIGNYMIKVGEPKCAFKICCAEEALSSI